MKTKSYVIAFVLAAIFFAIGVIVISSTWNELNTYVSEVPEGERVLNLPDPYDREAAEIVLDELLNAFYIKNLPLIGTCFGIVIFFLSLVCLWFGFAFRGFEKRMEKLEEGKKNV